MKFIKELYNYREFLKTSIFTESFLSYFIKNLYELIIFLLKTFNANNVMIYDYDPELKTEEKTEEL